MFADLPIQFERPGWLLLLLLIVPAFLIAWRSVGAMSRVKVIATFILRVVLVLLLTVALTNPSWERRGEGLTVSVILDRSHSIPVPLKDWALQYLREAAEHRRLEDRLASITVAADASIAAPPDPYANVTLGLDEGDRSATNLAAGLRLAMAIMPDDTANRIVLASDGNETVGSVLAVAEIAKANNVPIDVLILEYAHANEVLFDRIIAPAQARMGQTVPVRMVLRSQSEATGTINLRMNGEPLDLSPGEDGYGMRIALSPGVEVIPLTIRLDEPGPVQFEATFEPDSPEMDTIAQNNSAMAVTFVGAEGRVLVIDEGEFESAAIVTALKASEIAVERKQPDMLNGGLVELSGYDAVILANVPRWVFTDEQDRMLHAYVHDLGGGLIKIGGPEAFGAGGWIESETAKVLPVKLDPPQTRQMPRGALALVMHSCEMPQGNFWGQEVARAAINALSRLDYVGIIEYNWQQRGNFGATWVFPLQLAGDKQAALAATRKLVMGDMKDFHPMLQLAYDGLAPLNAGQKHIIIISDGDPAPPRPDLINRFIQANITITTVMVIGHGSALDRQRMQAMADSTGGRFYHVMNPTQLPQIFIKEAQLVSRSLIQEGDYQPQVVSRLPGPAEGYAAVPGIRGYVLTAKRDGHAQTPIVHATQEGQDPIYAHWNYGLGRSIAYTSDVTGRWGSQWANWAEFRSFWTQSVRWAMRPSSPANMMVNTRIDGDTAIVEVEALESDASFLNFLQTRGVVIAPGNRAEPLSLQQVGPGRYRGQFRLTDTGAYLVNVNYSAGADVDSQGNLQAAVTVPYSREYRAITHNGALLRQLAEMTGGRVLQSNLPPEDIDLFYRGRLEIPRSAKAIWDLLAIIAACLFIVDIAARRLAIDGPALARRIRRAFGQREEVGTSTVAAWKKTRDQVAHRRDRAPATSAAMARSARFEASEEDAAVAIDVGAEQPVDMTGSPAAAPRREAAEKPKPQDEGEYTSRLLAAKKRARQNPNDPANRGDGGT